MLHSTLFLSSMLMPIPEIPLGHWHLAMRTIPELGPGAATTGEATHQLFPVFNVTWNSKVGSLVVVCLGHAAGLAGMREIDDGIRTWP